MSTVISVDWDFFTPHGMYEEITFSDGTTMPGMLVFDWQMSERRAPEFERMLWETRCANFKRWGLDIQEMMKPKLSALDFCTEISIRMNGAMLPAWRGDSHAWAGILVRDLAEQFGPLDVINFDAHHDLGYRAQPLDDFKSHGNLHCDTWALAGLQQGCIQNYMVVYPDWLGRNEWPGIKPWYRKFKRQIQVCNWSEWLDETDEIEDPQAGFFCRSSSWTPPWLDENFIELVEEWGCGDCLDCEYGQHGSPFDTCAKREWDWKEIDVQLEQREKIFAELNVRIDAEKSLQKSNT